MKWISWMKIRMMAPVINAGYAGAVLSFRKSFIIPTPKQLKHLVDPPYKTSTETNISRFLLKTESLVYSPSLSYHFSSGSSSESKGGRVQYFVTMINRNKHRGKIFNI